MATTQLRLDTLLRALHFAGETEVDNDELECVLALLIQRRLIRGSIVPSHGVLVVAKDGNAFPLPSAGA